MKQDAVRRIRPLFIAGSTASGKSATALDIASRTGGEIVNADAFQLYRGLDTLTAKPAPEDFARVPHHLYSILDPGFPNCAAEYEALARPMIDEIASRGVLPIVVGGSGLYMKTLTHGLSPLPSGDPDLREDLAKSTAEEQASRLVELDPGALTAIDLANPRYVTRALEICLLTGQPASVLQREWSSRTVHFDGILLNWERETLYRRINERTTAMLANGAIDEVRELIENFGRDLPETAGKAIGIREIRDFLQGESTLEEAATLIRQATRRYAKRQITWFKRETGFVSIALREEDDASTLAERLRPLYPDLIT